MKEQKFTIEEIADYIAGWSMGSFESVQEIGKAALLNALSQLRCDQDGIAAVMERKASYRNSGTWDSQLSIKERVISVLADTTEIEAKDITLDFNLHNDFRIDSLDEIEIIMGLEDEFDLQIEEYDLANKCNTVGDLIKYIEKKL